MIETMTRVTGVSLPASEFRLHESFQHVEVDSVLKVLRGELAAYRVRNYLSAPACRQIVENFWISPKREPRYGDGEDGVEGYLIGASHIEKTTQEYLEEAQTFAEAVKNLYQGTTNPLDKFRNSLITEKGQYIRVRPAEMNGLTAGNSKAVYWNNLGEFLLLPHEDFAQLSDPRQKGFEIQQASRVMAVNFYPEVPENVGQLKIWNIEPDDRIRAELNLTHSGFPYPAELLADFPSLVIPVTTGDLCVINGNLAHAVIRGNPEASSKSRLLITCFMTFNTDNELIWWT